MKLITEKINTGAMESFRVIRGSIPAFDTPWHHHAEFELLFNIKSTGIRYVGDSIEHFSDGDMVFLGSNLPHVWKNEEVYYQEESELETEYIVLQFSRYAFGKDFFDLPEMLQIDRFLNKASQGLQITGQTRQALIPLLLNMVEQRGIQRLQILLQILDVLSQSSDLIMLSSSSFAEMYYMNAGNRLNRVLEYVSANFNREISLEEIAEVASMSKTAFCRYFKKASSRTFSQYLNEVRIGYACKLLIKQTYDLQELSELSGYHSVSYFSRQFRSITSYSPQKYRQHHLGINLD